MVLVNKFQLLWVLTRFVSYDVELFCAGCARQSEKALSNWVCMQRNRHIQWARSNTFDTCNVRVLLIHLFAFSSIPFGCCIPSLSFSSFALILSLSLYLFLILYFTVRFSLFSSISFFRRVSFYLYAFITLIRHNETRIRASKTLQGWTQSHFCKHYLLKKKCAFCFPYESFVVFSIYKLLALFVAHVIVIFAWEL